MDRCLFQLFLLLSLHVLTVAGGNPVLSTTDAIENEPFVIYCNPYVAGDPEPVVEVSSLSIYRRTTTAPEYSMSALLRSAPLKGANFTVANKPPYANWSFTFEGHRETKPGRKNLMKIQILVNTAQCNDSGSYFCRMLYYFNAFSSAQSLNSTPQELKVWSQSGNFELTYQPTPSQVNKADSSHLMYESGTSVNLNCSCKGPKGLVITWEMLVEEVRHSGYSSRPLPEPPNNPDPALVTTPAGCLQYLYTSTLKALVQPNKASVFKCVVRNETGQVYTQSLKLSTPEVGVDATTEASSIPKRSSDPAILFMVSIVGFLGSWYQQLGSQSL